MRRSEEGGPPPTSLQPPERKPPRLPAKARFPQSWGRCWDVRPAPNPVGVQFICSIFFCVFPSLSRAFYSVLKDPERF